RLRSGAVPGQSGALHVPATARLGDVERPEGRARHILPRVTKPLVLNSLSNLGIPRLFRAFLHHPGYSFGSPAHPPYPAQLRATACRTVLQGSNSCLVRRATPMATAAGKRGLSGPRKTS